MLKFIAAASGALFIVGCTSTIGPMGLTIPTSAEAVGYELVQHKIRGVNVTPGSKTEGAVNIIRMNANGTATATVDGNNQMVTGRWGMRGQQLCFAWPVRGTECWPYPAAMQVGQTVRLTSDRNITADITLLQGEDT
jgi:hypothetical protein